jgi:hypothetical protein
MPGIAAIGKPVVDIVFTGEKYPAVLADRLINTYPIIWKDKLATEKTFAE